jgi:hypothetical protein
MSPTSARVNSRPYGTYGYSEVRKSTPGHLFGSQAGVNFSALDLTKAALFSVHNHWPNLRQNRSFPITLGATVGWKTQVDTGLADSSGVNGTEYRIWDALELTSASSSVI